MPRSTMMFSREVKSQCRQFGRFHRRVQFEMTELDSGPTMQEACGSDCRTNTMLALIRGQPTLFV